MDDERPEPAIADQPRSAVADVRRDLTAELNNLRAANGALERQVMARGVKPNSTDTLYLQLEALKDLVVGDDPDARLRFDVAYQRHAHAMLTKLVEGLEQAKLQTPGKVLHLPGR